MSRREYRDRPPAAPRQKPRFQEGQAVYLELQEEWVRVLEVKFWDSGAPYYWIEREDGSSIAVSEDYLS